MPMYNEAKIILMSWQETKDKKLAIYLLKWVFTYSWPRHYIFCVQKHFHGTFPCCNSLGLYGNMSQEATASTSASQSSQCVHMYVCDFLVGRRIYETTFSQRLVTSWQGNLHYQICSSFTCKASNRSLYYLFWFILHWNDKPELSLIFSFFFSPYIFTLLREWETPHPFKIYSAGS